MDTHRSNRYLLRPRKGPMSSSYQPGYQPPTFNQPPSFTQQPGVRSQPSGSTPHLNLNTKIEDVTATLDGILPMIDSMKPSDPFQISVCNVLRLLVGQMKEIKLGQVKLQDSTISSLGVVDDNLVDLTRTAVKGEQYHRRDTLTVTGVPKRNEETVAELGKKVAESLSLSGETVTPDDFSVIHRNGNRTKKNHQGKDIPPSVTVRFSKIGKKDKVLRGYKNYDVNTKTSKSVKVFQSLSPHYSGLRQYIVNFFGTDNVDANLGKQLKWCTYQSPSAGLAVKLKSDEFMRDIHVVDDFLFKFAEICQTESA